ncbi:hypothetical protein V8E53_004961 [Lactarius tabidus]
MSARNPSQDNIHLPRRVPLIYATTPRLHFPLHHPLYYHRSSPHPQARGHRHLSLPGSSQCSGAIFHSAQCTSKLSFPHFSAAWRSTRASSFVLPLSSSNQFEPQFLLERHVVEVLDRKQRVASSFSNTYWPTPALGLPHATLCDTKVCDCVINEGASTKSLSSSSDPPLDIEMTDISPAIPCAWGIRPSSMRASFIGGGYGWYRIARRLGNVWNRGQLKLPDVGGPRSGDRS